LKRNKIIIKRRKKRITKKGERRPIPDDSSLNGLRSGFSNRGSRATVLKNCLKFSYVHAQFWQVSKSVRFNTRAFGK
jgi:hypothetical protein